MNFLALCDLILTILIFAHFFACAWAILHRFEKEYLQTSVTWLDKAENLGKKYNNKYIE